MRQGFIILHRKGITPDEWKNPRRTLAWIDLLTLTNHEDSVVTVSYGFLAERWRVSKNTAHLWIKHWITERQLERLAERSAERNAERFFVVNFAKYQTSPEREAERSTERRTERKTEQRYKVSSIKSDVSTEKYVDDGAKNAPTPSQYAKEFFENNKVVLIAESNYWLEKGIPLDIVRQEFQKFLAYWTEKNKSGTKQRWQLQKTFEVRLRLSTWFSRTAQDYQKKKGSLTMPDFRSPKPQ